MRMNAWLFLAMLFGGWAVIGGAIALTVLYPRVMVPVLIGAFIIFVASVARHHDERR